MSIATPHDPAGDSTAEPAWDIARLFPDQGTWSAGDYLDLTNSTNHRVELNDGNIEVLSMPTEAHEFIVRFLFLALYNFGKSKKLGEVFSSGIRVRTRDANYRMPDIVFMLDENRSKRTNEFWNGADLVMEVVSPDAQSRDRDLKHKKREYAEAQIPEYWIVDPQENRIVVLTLVGQDYVEHGTFRKGQNASGALLDGFSVDVAQVFQAAEDR